MRLYGYGSIPINTIFRGMNIHLPAILMFTRGARFWHTAISLQFSQLDAHICRTTTAVPWFNNSEPEVVLDPKLPGRSTGVSSGDLWSGSATGCYANGKAGGVLGEGPWTMIFPLSYGPCLTTRGTPNLKHFRFLPLENCDRTLPNLS